MVYGSSEQTPYEHEGRREPDDVREETKAESARALLEVAWGTGYFSEGELERLDVAAALRIEQVIYDVASEHGFEDFWPTPCRRLAAALRYYLRFDDDARAAVEQQSRARWSR